MAGKPLRILDSLPEFPVPASHAWSQLVVAGLVEKPVSLALDDLRQMPLTKVALDFHCREGWVVPNQVWEGVPVSALLDIAAPSPEARFVSFGDGEFSAVLPLDAARDAGTIVALRLNGAPIPNAHGGPCRLVSSDEACFRSVKWLSNIELTAEHPGEPAKKIALARLESR